MFKQHLRRVPISLIFAHLHDSSKINKIKGNEISVKELRSDSVAWLTELHQTMLVKDYGKGSVRNYWQEMRLLFKYYNHKAVADIRQADIMPRRQPNKPPRPTGSYIFM